MEKRHSTKEEQANNGLLIKARLKTRPLVLVGLMGSGKTSIGRRLAARLALPFMDSDAEIEQASGMSIPEIFERHGEQYFREGEVRVISRLATRGPIVLATGGGAFMNPATRATLHEKAITLWLNADVDLLFKRVAKRPNRPLLKTKDPYATLQGFIETRYPFYAQAEITVVSQDVPHEEMVEVCLTALRHYLGMEAL
jgi:shikimate kinase